MDQHELDVLIQNVLDGVATSQQAARLEARLGQDPAARERQTELAHVFAALRKSHRFEAPPELRARIMRALPPGAPGVRAGAPAADLQRRFRLAYVFAFGLAAGIIVAGVLAGFWKAPPPGGAPVIGSMMPPSTPGAIQAHWQAGPARVEARTWRVGVSRMAAFRVTGAAAEIELSFDPAALRWAAFRSAPQAQRATLEPGKVVFRGAEQTETVVELRDVAGAAPLQIMIRAGAESATGTLPAPAVPENP